MAITAATAKAVRNRELDRCQLCGGREWEDANGFNLHHLRSKSMGGTADPQRDVPERLALLHAECHREVHANPREARALGLIESRLGTIRPSALLQRGPA